MRYEIIRADTITIPGREDLGIVTGTVEVYLGHPGSYYDPPESPDILDISLTYADGSAVDVTTLADDPYDVLWEALWKAVEDRRVEEADMRAAAEEERPSDGG
ncbi:MAG: hypothetical protein EBT79_06490 [Actinobacteria bacterium]|nr:hypothetical protein [Actinomycetota bacterium]